MANIIRHSLIYPEKTDMEFYGFPATLRRIYDIAKFSSYK